MTDELLSLSDPNTFKEVLNDNLGILNLTQAIEESHSSYTFTELFYLTHYALGASL